MAFHDPSPSARTIVARRPRAPPARVAVADPRAFVVILILIVVENIPARSKWSSAMKRTISRPSVVRSSHRARGERVFPSRDEKRSIIIA